MSAWNGLIESWLRSLRARNLADSTLHVYERAGRHLIDWLDQHHPALSPEQIRREHVEAFLADFGQGRSASYASQVYRGLQQWMKWLLAEDEIDADPMARMEAPIVPEIPVPVLSEDQLRLLLASCQGRRLVDRRDMALLRLMVDTGGRLAEISNLKVADVDLDQQVCRVLGKGRKERLLPFGMKTAEALDRYLRARKADRRSDEPGLWLGEKGKGALTGNGVYQIVKRKGRALGLPDLHPHMFRHTSSHRWLAAGGSEGDLMQINGWKSRAMLSRYAASAAAERARDAHKKLALGDQI